KERGLPKTLLANQKKYMEALEKQQKMLNSKKDKRKSMLAGKNPKEKKATTLRSANSGNDTDGIERRRLIIGGRVKYMPIKQRNNSSNDTDNEPIVTKSVNQQNVSGSKTSRPKQSLPLRGVTIQDKVIERSK